MSAAIDVQDFSSNAVRFGQIHDRVHDVVNARKEAHRV